MSKQKLKINVSKIREILIKSIAGRLEKYGFDDEGLCKIDKPLNENDRLIKANLICLFCEEKIAGDKNAFVSYIQESARTFFHVLLCFIVMERTKVIKDVLSEIFGNNLYSEIIPDFKSIHPLAYQDFVLMYEKEISNIKQRDENEADSDYYNILYLIKKLSLEMSKEVPILFSDFQYNLIQPDFDAVKEVIFFINEIEDCEFLEDDFMSWIYQYWIDVNKEDIISARKEKEIGYSNQLYFEIVNKLEEKQIQYGEFYTPRWVVSHIVNVTLLPYLIEKRNFREIRILDPACGAGNFLVYSFDVLFDEYKKEYPNLRIEEIIKSILENNIFGADIQREPLQIAALNLWFKAKRKAFEYGIEKYKVSHTNIIKANSLYRWENEAEIVQLSIFDDVVEFSEKQYTTEDIGRYISAVNSKSHADARRVFSKQFDVVLMNPPYLGVRKMSAESSNFIKKEYPLYCNNYFEAFVKRALELVRKEGVIGLIGSDTFLTIESHENIRSLLLKESTITNIVKLGNGVFDGPSVSSVIFTAIKSKPRKDSFVLCSIQSDVNNKFDLMDEKKILQQDFNKIIAKPFIVGFNHNFVALFNKYPEFDKIVEIKQGMITGDNKKFLRYKWEIPINILGTSWIPYAKSDGYEKWINNNFNYILWEDDGYEVKKEAKRKYGSVSRTVKNQDYFFREGIAFSNIGAKDFAVKHLPEGKIFDLSSSCIFSNEINYHYLMGFLNSKFVNFILYNLNPTINFQVSDIKRIPYKIPDKNTEDSVIEEVKKAIELKEISFSFNYQSEFFKKTEIEFGFDNGAKSIAEACEIYKKCMVDTQSRLRNIQDKVDGLIYSLYDLKNEDIELIEKESFGLRESINYESSNKKIVVNYLRSILKNELKSRVEKIFTHEDVDNIIKMHIETHSRINAGHELVDEIEEVLEKSIMEFIKTGTKINSKVFYLYGADSKDLDEPLLQHRVLSGTTSDKQIVIWYLSHFLLEFEDDKKYVMQNEIRRLSNEVYRPRLQTVKEKLQENVMGAEKKELEKQEKLLSEAVKTLEAWKVVN